MLVLHAYWALEAVRLRVWAEDGSRATAAASGRGRSRVRPHPFVIELAGLRTALGRLGCAPSRNEAEDWWGVLLLPSTAGAPLPSPPLVREADTATTAAAEIAPWKVPALSLAPIAARRLLLALPDEPEDGVAIGDDLEHLREVALLAADLVARGRVLPIAEPTRPGPGHAARWRPALSGLDADRRRALARSMPGAVRCAEVRSDVAEPAIAVLDGALDALADASARHALAHAPRRPRQPGAAVFESWLRGLTTRDGAVRGGARELAELDAALADWGAEQAQRDAAVRTCLRLEAPTDEDGREPWRLDLLLQSAADPSVTVPAAEVFAAAEGSPVFFGQPLHEPHARLHADLARAARLFKPLAELVAEATPSGLDLDATAALVFLREAAPLLHGAGIGVLLPDWWEAPQSRLGLRLRATPRDGSTEDGLAPAGLGLGGIVDVDWAVILGGDALTLAELEELAALKAPLVRARGRWVEVGPADLERAARLLGSGAPAAPIAAADVLRTLLGAVPAPAGLPLVEVAATGWLGQVLAGEGAVGEERTPTAFVGELRPYQRRGLAWLELLGRLGLGACLADDMGLGKTIQLLALLLAEREGGSALPPTLLVCPMSLISNWRHESARFAPSLVVRVHHGGERPRDGEGADADYGDADLVLTTYALVARDRDALAGVPWGRVVLDEAQAIKNPSSQAARAVRSLQAPQRVALTGTPVENRLSELWSIMEFLNAGLLGTLGGFRRRIAMPIERLGDDEAADRLARVVRPFVLRRSKTDRSVIDDLPAKIEIRVYAPLTREQVTLYRAVVDDLLTEVDAETGIRRRGLVLATLTRLKQVCDHPALLLGDGSPIPGRSGKLALLEEVLAEVIDAGERALVFTQYAALCGLLRPHLQRTLGQEVLAYHGGLTRTARDQTLKRFDEPDGPPVLLLTLKAGGTGLNLAAANHVIHFDRWWNPAVEAQATDRAYRIGQTRDVQVRTLICSGTVEDRIDELIESKRALAERVVGAGETWLGDLSTADLRELLTLGSDTEQVLV